MEENNIKWVTNGMDYLGSILSNFTVFAFIIAKFRF